MSFHLGYYYTLILSSFIYGLTTVRRGSPLPFRMLLWWLIVTIPTEVTATVMARLYHNNLWVYNIWQPFDCCMILLMFYYGIAHRTTRRVFRWLLVLAAVVVLIFSLRHFVTMSLNLSGMLFYLFCELIGACLFLTDGLLPGEERSIFQRPFSWMALGVILFSCAYILIHSLWQYIATWPKGRYQTLTDLANTFEYAGVWMTLYSLRKSRAM